MMHQECLDWFSPRDPYECICGVGFRSDEEKLKWGYYWPKKDLSKSLISVVVSSPFFFSVLLLFFWSAKRYCVILGRRVTSASDPDRSSDWCVWMQAVESQDWCVFCSHLHKFLYISFSFSWQSIKSSFYPINVIRFEQSELKPREFSDYPQVKNRTTWSVISGQFKSLPRWWCRGEFVPME